MTQEQFTELMESNMRLLENKYRFLNMVINPQSNNEITMDEKFKDEIASLIALQKKIDNIKIDDFQSEAIEKFCNTEKLELSQLPIIKNNLLESLRSGLKYIENFYEHPVNNKKFDDDRFEGFSPVEVAICNVLPFMQHDSERYDEMLARSFSSDRQEPQISDEDVSRIVKTHGTQKPGTLLTLLLSSIEEVDFSDPICLMKRYTLLLEYGLSELYKSNKTKDRLTLKRKRLFFSFSNGEVETCLKFSHLLFPYVQGMQTVLQIPGYDEIFTYQSLIEQELDARKLEVQSPPPFSRKVIEALQARQKQEEAECTKQVELPVIVKKKPLLLTETTTPEEQYSLSPTPQNLKKEYMGPADQDIRDKRKQEAKEMKKKNVQPLERSVKFLEEKVEQPKAQTFLIKIGGGPFKIYNKIMNGTFKGSMEKVVVLMEALGGIVDEGRSGSRIKFELPHIMTNTTAYLDMLPPEYEGENDELAVEIQNTPMPNVPVIHDGMHVPHKNKSNKLRPEHIEDVKKLLIRAGYVEGAIQKQ